jgi:hypothetical protein
VIHASRTYVTIWYVCFLSASGSLAPAVAQNKNAEEQDEIKAVFRISKAFLAEVTDRPIVADIPLCATVLKFRCAGVIHGEGKVSVGLQKSGQQAVFEVTSRGNGSACVTGVRGPLVASGLAWGPFTSRTLVRFDGRNFTHIVTIPAATVCADVQRVTGRRDRRIGRFMGSSILPMTDKLIPRAVAEATPIANRYLQEFVEDTADKIITRLNQETPVEESVNRLFPETQDWEFQMSSDDQFLQAMYGAPGAPIPSLPDVPTEMEDIRLEAWLRSTAEEAKLLAEMSKRPLARQLVQRYLESTLPELAALAEERSVDAVDSWVVIRIGAPDPN